MGAACERREARNHQYCGPRAKAPATARCRDAVVPPPRSLGGTVLTQSCGPIRLTHSSSPAPKNKEVTVQRINEFALYELAGHLKQLAKYDTDTPKSAIWIEAMQARYALDRLLEDDPVPIEFSSESARQLRNWIDTMFLKDSQGMELNLLEKGDEIVYGWVLNRYGRLLQDFETIFATEMRGAATYFVPRCGIYHTPSLVDRAENAFPDELRELIPDKSKQDWQAAGRCLAFSLYSASGFHVTRAVEGTLESYYQRFCNKLSGSTLHGWHDYIEALKKVTESPMPSEKTLAEIEQMKDDYRNPLAHPRVVLSETDARMLFDNGESLIISMVSELRDAGLSSEAPAAALAAPAA